MGGKWKVVAGVWEWGEGGQKSANTTPALVEVMGGGASQCVGGRGGGPFALVLVCDLWCSWRAAGETDRIKGTDEERGMGSKRREWKGSLQEKTIWGVMGKRYGK